MLKTYKLDYQWEGLSVLEVQKMEWQSCVDSKWWF